MPTYSFSARRASGDMMRGTENAETKQALIARLSDRGLLVVDVSRKTNEWQSFKSRGRVNDAAKLGFVRELVYLLNSGMGVAPALEILQNRPGNPALGEAISALLDRLKEGADLDQAAAARPDVFDQVFQSSIGVGQRTSKLGEAMSRYAGYLSMRAELRRKFGRALAYPIFLLVLLVVVLAILMLFVLPRFATLYADFGSELPMATRVLVGAVESAKIWLPLLLVSIIAVPAGFKLARKNMSARLALDKFAVQMPLAGTVAKDVQLVQISYMLSSLLKAGAPMAEALQFVGSSLSNMFMRRKVLRVGTLVQEGKSFSDAVEAEGLFPYLSISMVRAGDASGALPDMLDAVSELHEKRAEDRMANLLALIEPTIMALVGIVLGAVVISVYLPIFGISGVVQ